jgi:hypothetical protein
MRSRLVKVICVLTPLACLVWTGCTGGSKGEPENPSLSERPGFKPPVQSVFKSPAELFAGIPEDAYPQGGANGARQAAVAWFAKNRAGHLIEWTATIKDVSLDKDSQMVTVVLSPEGKADAAAGWSWDKAVPIRTETCQTMIHRIVCGQVTAVTAKKLGEWQGKKVSLRALITSVGFDVCGKGADPGPTVCCQLDVALHSIDGYVPPVQKPSMRQPK